MKNKIARHLEAWRGDHQVEAGPEEKEEKEEREENHGGGGNDCSVHTRSALE